MAGTVTVDVDQRPMLGNYVMRTGTYIAAGSVADVVTGLSRVEGFWVCPSTAAAAGATVTDPNTCQIVTAGATDAGRWYAYGLI